MASSPAADATRPRAARWVGLCWLACCALLIWLCATDIATLAFRDPDDAMRLQQVRDWIGGQGFHDVSQHRVNPPTGGPMHWSRIVDMPIAALILLLRPLMGGQAAEVAALVIVPLLLLGTLSAALFLATSRLSDRKIALAACLLLLSAPSILVQFLPLRIDHHGWQILLAAAALAGAFDSRPVRGGIVAGAALAAWLQISSEGLPFAALFVAAFALRQWHDRAHTSRFVAMAATLGVGAPLLLALLRGTGALLDRQCDALSLPFVWPLAGLGIATLVAARLIGATTAGQRFAIAAIGGGTALALFAALGGPCLSGDPFATLGPTAYRLWYLKVMEGRPIWEQGIDRAGIILLPSLIGLAATLAAARAQGAERADWIMMALLLAGATAISCLVARALSVAHMLALPGIAWMLIAAGGKLHAKKSSALRVAGCLALLMLTPLGSVLLWLTLAPGSAEDGGNGRACRAPASIAPLARLPRGVMLTPLDMGPDLLVHTRHAVIGTAHHRNAAGITATIDAYTRSPMEARMAMARLNGGRGVDYLIFCRDLNEMRTYARDYPKGLAAMLMRNAPPPWLKRSGPPGPIAVYQVVAPGRKDIATPFMQ